MGSCNRSQKRIHTKERESISLVERRKRRSKRVYPRVNKEVVYKTIKIITDSTGIFCGKERWKKEDSTGLLISK